MKKEKQPKVSKRQAFMSFLESPNTASTTTDSILKKNNSDHQEYEQVMVDNINCSICATSLNTEKAKKCGFCNLFTCSQHLRKRRKKKNKFQRICDDCQDKYLYESYMKLELKAQEAISVEEQIITLKYKEMLNIVESKRQQRRQLSFKQQQLNEKYERKIKQLTFAQNNFLSKQHQIQSDQLHIRQLQEYIKRVNLNIKQNYQQDFNFMSIQNQKLRKQLALYQKRCDEIKTAIQKKQKQLQQAYEKWQTQQFRKSIIEQPPTKLKNNSKDDNGCNIY